ncbi:hypothetical protein HDU93_000814 [Gonapodya sp. JEL0774]|nr:hypothetical protein HDU93_000814 [Gonapodya sp. JEL0774]
MLNYHFLCQGCIPKRNLPQYQFAASAQSGSGTLTELHEWTTASWKNILTTAIANLTLSTLQEDTPPGQPLNPIIPDTSRYHFGKNDSILPFVDRFWNVLCKNRSRTPTWQTTVGSRLYEEREAFKVIDEPKAPKPSRATKSKSVKADQASATTYQGGIRPPAAEAPASHILTEISTQKAKKRRFERGVEDTTAPSANATDLPGGPGGVYIPNYTELARLYPPPPSPRAVDHPFNAEGYKYEMATPTPNKPFTDNVRSLSSFESRGEGVWWSSADRSPQVAVERGGLTVSNDGGFRTVRATHGVKEGCWYFEIYVDKGGGEGRTSTETNDGAHVRVGWSRREGAINAPVGYDSYSYSYRDVTGEKIHEAQTTPFAEPFTTGDVIGCLINLPRYQRPRHNYRPTDAKRRYFSASGTLPVKKPGAQVGDGSNNLLNTKLADIPWESMTTVGHPRQRSVIRYKGSLVFESGEYQPINRPPILYMIHDSRPRAAQKYPTVVDKVPPWHSKITSNSFPVLEGSFIRFFKNGKDLGNAFTGLPMPIPAAAFLPPEKIDQPLESHWPSPPYKDDGSYGYYPSVSLFRGGKVTANFGPHFQYPPPGDLSWRPMSDRFIEREIEETMWDILDEIDATIHLTPAHTPSHTPGSRSRMASSRSGTPIVSPVTSLRSSTEQLAALAGDSSPDTTAHGPLRTQLKTEYPTDSDADAVMSNADSAMELTRAGDFAATETSTEYPDESRADSVLPEMPSVDEDMEDAEDESVTSEDRHAGADLSQSTSRDGLSDDSDADTDTQRLEANFIKGLHAHESGPRRKWDTESEDDD